MKRLVILLIILTAVLAALCAAIFILHSKEAGNRPSSAVSGAQADESLTARSETGTALTGSGSVSIGSADSGSAGTGSSNADQTATVSVENGKVQEQHVFSDEEMNLIKELIFAKADGRETGGLLEELEKISPESGEAWIEIFDYWDETRSPGFVNTLEDGGKSITDIDGCPIDDSHEGTLLPEGLPEDDSLCMICLGYQLYSDGTMMDELVGRLETLRACAMQYPNSMILLTGGPTAFADRSVTEADVMAEWLVENGVDRDRIIIENRSLTSATNALFSYELLNTQYPQVRDIAIISSDYHVALGSQLFQAQFILARELGSDTELNVRANASYHVDMREMFGSDIEANWIWILVQEQTAEIHNIEGEM